MLDMNGMTATSFNKVYRWEKALSLCFRSYKSNVSKSSAYQLHFPLKGVFQSALYNPAFKIKAV